MQSTYESRKCSRCGLRLEDLSSFAVGVGPICQKKDKHLYSKLFPVSHAYVFKFLMDFNPDNLQIEIREKALNVKRSILDKLQFKLNSISPEELMSGKILASEFIKDVKEIDYLLSWSLPIKEKENLINLVKYLGFPALASVFAGKASTGDASIKFENGKFVIIGSRVKAAYEEFKKYQDIVLPRRGVNKEYFIPAKYVDDVYGWIYEFWPIIDDKEIDIALKAAKEHNRNYIEPIIANSEINNNINKTSTNGTYLKIINGKINFFMVWDKKKSYSIINELKDKISYKNRTYDPKNKSWLIDYSDVNLLNLSNILEKYNFDFEIISS